MKLYIFLISILFTSCYQQPKKVAVLFDNLQNERWLRDKEFLQTKFSEKNTTVLFRLANGDPDLQYKQAVEAIDSGVKVIVIVAADLFESARIVELAHRNNVKVISYDRLMKDSEPDIYISFDNVEVGKLQADYLTKKCPEGNYAIIGGATYDNNSFLLRIGQMNILQPFIDRGDIKLVYDQFADNWSAESGYIHMKQILKLYKVDAVVAANDQLAIGAVKAMAEADTSLKVYLSGQDATVEACRNILSGDQTMTVYKSIDALTEKTVDVAERFMKDSWTEDGTRGIYNGARMIPSILLTPEVVNKETMQVTVFADGYIAKEDL